jgi:DNA-binding NtrC family response regulator
MPGQPPESTEPYAAPPATDDGGRLRLWVASSPDRSFEDRWIELERRLCMGRAGGDADLQADDRRASRRHADLTPTADGRAATVSDLGSTNGVFVDGARIDGATLLGEGSVLRIGDTLAIATRARPPSPHQLDEALLGHSAPWVELVDAVHRLGATDLTVLIAGETGTGKELIARRLHDVSGRRGRFVPVNCGALPPTLVQSALFGHVRGSFTGADETREGFFRAAEGGTIFLDEIGDFPREAQANLLRVLEEREVYPVGATEPKHIDVRVLAATHADLETGSFRADLHARLAEAEIVAPPLRERRLDVLPLFRHLLRVAAPDRTFELSADFAEALLLHPWPRNVRQLRAVARQLGALCPDGTVLDQTHAAATEIRPALRPEPTDRARLVAALRKHAGNVKRVAQEIGCARSQVYRLLERYELDAAAFR